MIWKYLEQNVLFPKDLMGCNIEFAESIYFKPTWKNPGKN